MRKYIGVSVAIVALLAGTAISARERVSPECRRAIVKMCEMTGIKQCVTNRFAELDSGCRAEIVGRMKDRARADGAKPLPTGAREVAFGDDPAQRYDLFMPRTNAPVPLIVFVHGGGWSIGDKRSGLGEKATHFNALGYAVASINYRLVPQGTVEQQAADVAAAVASLRKQPGIDGSRVVVMGHSAGAHLAALVASDTRYLGTAGIPVEAVRGVVLLDGAGYDVVRQMADPKNAVQSMYDKAFGTDPARQRALSPITYVATPNARDWLILPVASRADPTAQSQDFAAALRMGASRVTVTPVPDSSHMKLNRNLGSDGDFATEAVDAFVGAAFGR